MDLINTLQIPLQVIALQKASAELLPQLQQAGLFRALVLETQGNRVILDTAFGKIIGRSPTPLNQGDEILTRLLPGKSEPDLKIEQHIPRLLTLNNKSLSAVLSQSGKPLLEARVVASDVKQTVIQIGKKQYQLAPQKLLKAGDALLLKSLPKNQVELVRIQPQIILKNALSVLLPRNQSAPKDTGLTSLLKLSQSILHKAPSALKNSNISVKTEMPVSPSTLSPKQQLIKQIETLIAQSNRVQSNKTQPNKQPPQAASKAINTTEVVKLKAADLPVQNIPLKINTADNLKSLLGNLSISRLNVSQVKPATIQKVLTLLSLLKPSTATSLTSLQNLQTIPRQLETLQQALLKSPDQMTQLIRQLLINQADVAKSTSSERLLQDFSSSFRTELLQQVEQTLNHLLIQKTSVRLQVEQNQPLQINLNIPLLISEKTTTELKLKIKQKNQKESVDEQHWEINLSFEFGLLGLISTHLLLQEKKISAHFWAVEPATKNLIDHHLDDFKNQLVKSGFDAGYFDSHLGHPSESNDSDQPLSDNLVDINV